MLWCMLMKETFLALKSMNQRGIKYILEKCLIHAHMSGTGTEIKRIGIAS